MEGVDGGACWFSVDCGVMGLLKLSARLSTKLDAMGGGGS